MNKLRLLCCLIVICGGCNNKHPDNGEEIIDLGNSQFLQKEYKDGLLVKEKEFSRSKDNSIIANGYEKDYFPNGKVKCELHFVNGKQDSLQLRYYPNGNIKYRLYETNGQSFGPQMEFYENGKIKGVYFHLNDSVYISKVKYNLNGKVDSIDGSFAYFAAYKKPILLHDTLMMAIHVLMPSGMRIVLNLKLLDERNKILIDTVISKFDYADNSFYHEELRHFDKKGKYQYESNIQLFDSATHKMVKQNTNSFIVNVF
jgi:antitoxin component YwqK of YwqJK toxin-antitoxin module